MRGATLTEDDWRAFAEFQSTRPVRGATRNQQTVENSRKISIHAPRAGRDFRWLRGSSVRPNFNPRAPCGARQRSEDQTKGERYFNPRAPCGARLLQSGKMSQQQLFQSTRPVRGATSAPGILHPPKQISIHAPRAGRDRVVCAAQEVVHDFNPRAPCGARRQRGAFRQRLSRISIHAPRAGRDKTSSEQ